MSYKGKFKPKNPQKYKGDPTNIIYRSLWELRVFRYCDLHPDIIEWQSEEIAIPYLNPTKINKNGTKKVSRYYPDVILKRRDKDGTIKKIMIEIKPKAQTKPPDLSKKNNTPSGRVSTRWRNAMKTYAINEAKWNAAREYCADRGWEFTIMTEDNIF